MGFLERLKAAFTGSKQPPLGGDSKSAEKPAPEPTTPSAHKAEPPPVPSDAPVPEPSAPAPQMPADHDARTYTVQPGDTLWKIAETHYGNGADYMKIFEANRDLLDDPNKIFPGQELKIP